MSTLKETEQKLAAEAVAKAVQGTEAERLASAIPTPGPLAEVFAEPQDIAVGKRRVRPFYDFDFKVLQKLEHPVYRMMVMSVAGKDTAEDFIPAGDKCWQLLWVMTHTVPEVKAALKDGTLDAKAAEEFELTQMHQNMPLVNAVFEQMRRYWSPVVAHGAEGEKRLPPS